MKTSMRTYEGLQRKFPNETLVEYTEPESKVWLKGTVTGHYKVTNWEARGLESHGCVIVPHSSESDNQLVNIPYWNVRTPREVLTKLEIKPDTKLSDFNQFLGKRVRIRTFFTDTFTGTAQYLPDVAEGRFAIRISDEPHYGTADFDWSDEWEGNEEGSDWSLGERKKYDGWDTIELLDWSE